MKLLVVPSKKEEIEVLLDMDIDGLILPIKHLSVYSSFQVSLNYVRNLDRKDKKIFISMNKIMHNDNIEYVKTLLDEAETLDVDGIFVSDVGLFNLVKHMEFNAVLDQVHLINNYKTCDYYASKGAEYVVLSNELMFDDIKDISEKTSTPLMMQVFGYIPMLNSYRKLLTNYFDYIKQDKTAPKYYMYDENRKSKYLIDEQDETTIYSANIMTAIDEAKDMKIEYGIINGFNIQTDILYKVINDFKNGSSYNDMMSYIPNIDKGFLYKECIYKVREHE